MRQTKIVRDLLIEIRPDLEIEIRVVSTSGDRRSATDAEVGEGTGLFTRELEEALLKGEIHAAVHSLKDLPVQLENGLALVAIPRRGVTEDVLISRIPGGLKALPIGARLGTGSPRRQMQIRALRGDLTFAGIRGNVPTRIQKLAQNPALDGIVLAKAGLDRLDLIQPDGTIQPGDGSAVLHVEILTGVLPAPGQGAIAVQARSADSETAEIFAGIDDEDTASCVETEREVLRLIGGGCQLPLGTLATREGHGLALRAVLFEGDRIRRAEVTGSTPSETAAAAFGMMHAQTFDHD